MVLDVSKRRKVPLMFWQRKIFNVIKLTASLVVILDGPNLTVSGAAIFASG
jgi:hypothetical protein